MNLLKMVGFLPYCKLDEQQPHRLAQPLLFAIKNQNYNQCEAIMSDASLQNISFILEGFAYPHNAVTLAQAWLEEEPNSFWANIVYARTKIHEAWQHRGESYAEDVDDDAWQLFFECLADSEPALYRAMELDKESAYPHSSLIIVAMAQDASAEQLSDIFEQAILLHPLHFPSYYTYFSTLTEKWGGSNELMFDFVRKTCHELPTGHMLHGLLALAYSEYILQLSTDRDVKFALQVVKKPQHAMELTSSFYQWLDATPDNIEEKLERKCADSTQGSVRSFLNHYAMVLYVSGAEYEAKLAAKALNGEIHSVPWCWIPQSTKQQYGTEFIFDSVCKKLGIL